MQLNTRVKQAALLVKPALAKQHCTPGCAKGASDQCMLRVRCSLLTGWDVGEARRVQRAYARLLAQAGVNLPQLFIQPLHLILALPGRHT